MQHIDTNEVLAQRGTHSIACYHAERAHLSIRSVSPSLKLFSRTRSEHSLDHTIRTKMRHLKVLLSNFHVRKQSYTVPHTTVLKHTVHARKRNALYVCRATFERFFGRESMKAEAYSQLYDVFHSHWPHSEI